MAWYSDFYEAACPGYYASYLPDRPPLSTPVLFDSKTRKIVSNESAEVRPWCARLRPRGLHDSRIMVVYVSQIIKMLNSEFNEWATNPDLDLNPEVCSSCPPLCPERD